MRLALFQAIDDESSSHRIEGPDFETDAHDYGYFRVSEYVDVEFPLADPDTVQRELVAIGKYESCRRESFEARMRLIGEFRARLQGDGK